MKKGTKKLFKTAAALGGAALVGYAAGDIAKNLSVKAIPDLPQKEGNSGLMHQLLFYFENPEQCKADGVVIDDAYILDALRPAKEYIDGRYDCQDFRMQSLLRLQYAHGEKLLAISPDGAQMLEDIFLNAKFWMTEPGEDSMCYWSENHQILYAVAEYLAGQYWAERTFSNDGCTGLEHMQRGRERLRHWIDHRLKYGFSEYNSANYLKFNIGPAANFIQFAAQEDEDIKQSLRMVLDLLLYDVAMNMFRFTFLAPTGRAYVDNMVGATGDRLSGLIDYVWGRNDAHSSSTDHMLMNFYLMMQAKDEAGKPLYEIPQVLREIGLDENTRVSKFSDGMNVKELEEKGYVGHTDNQIMMQLGMESFTNPEVIANTVSYLRKNNMFSNKFVNFFKILNLKAVQSPSTMRAISEKMNPMPNGIAIQRANLYVYRTPDYQLSNVQRYHPGCFGAQQMLQTLNFGGQSVVFTTHPAREETEKTVRGYPGYWAGFGRSPHSVQHENVLLMLYRIPKIPGFLELYAVPQFTHTYLPEAYLDEVILEGRYAFARQGNAYLALIGAGELSYKPFSADSAKAFKSGIDAFPDKRFDLIQNGNRQFWIYELSDASREDFTAFMERIKANRIEYLVQQDGHDRLAYTSGDTSYFTSYGRDLAVNARAQELEYKRFDSDYCSAEREQTVFDFACNGHTLHIDYAAGIREHE